MSRFLVLLIVASACVITLSARAFADCGACHGDDGYSERGHASCNYVGMDPAEFFFECPDGYSCKACDCFHGCNHCANRCDSCNKCNTGCESKCDTGCKPKCDTGCKPKCDMGCKPKCETKCDSCKSQCGSCKPKCKQHSCSHCNSGC